MFHASKTHEKQQLQVFVQTLRPSSCQVKKSMKKYYYYYIYRLYIDISNHLIYVYQIIWYMIYMAKKAVLCLDTQSPGCSWQNAMNVNVCRKQRCSLWHMAHRPGARSTHCALQSKSLIFCCEVASDVIQLCTDSISGKVDILQKIRAVQRFVECKINLTIPILDVHINWCCEGIWHLTNRTLCTCTQQAEGKDPP